MVTERQRLRHRRHLRVRRKIAGTAVRPRLSVFRSLRHVYAQVVDDEAGRTVAAASSRESAAADNGSRGNAVLARRVGQLLAERARAAGVTRVVFDRGGYLYHGRVQALAEAAREAGLEF